MICEPDDRAVAGVEVALTNACEKVSRNYDEHDARSYVARQILRALRRTRHWPALSRPVGSGRVALKREGCTISITLQPIPSGLYDAYDAPSISRPFSSKETVWLAIQCFAARRSVPDFEAASCASAEVPLLIIALHESTSYRHESASASASTCVMSLLTRSFTGAAPSLFANEQSAP